jgi:phosphoribosylformimino-5-aminoimidazole carboxamide ribotide isomerase
MKIIPAIDIIEGKCVRLTRGHYDTKKEYNENPLELALRFEDAGLKYLHLVDLDGAKSNHIVNHHVLETLAAKTNLQIDFGGGIKTDADIQLAFNCGAARVTAGSIAAQQPETVIHWLQTYGSEKIILGADCKKGKILTGGWQTTTDKDILSFIQFYELKGIRYVISTDVAKDGMLQGPSVSLYKKILNNTGVQLIASGGVTDITDLHVLKKTGCYGAIIGKAIYEGRININELSLLC